MRRLGVLFEIDIDGAEGDPLAVGRDDRLADALQLHHVFERERALGLGEATERTADQEKEQTTKHEASEQQHLANSI